VETLANKDHVSSSASTQLMQGTRKYLDKKVEKKKDVPNFKPIISPPPPPLPPPRHMHTPGPTTYSSSALPVKKTAIQKSPKYLDLSLPSGV